MTEETKPELVVPQLDQIAPQPAPPPPDGPATCPLCKRAVQMIGGNIKPHRPKRGVVDPRINTNVCTRIELRAYVCDGAHISMKSGTSS